MDFVHTGREYPDPEERLRRPFYVGNQSPWFVETALIQRIMVTKTLCGGILGLSLVVRVARLGE
jgi:hypothetical protein